MAAASSSTSFFGVPEENPTQITHHQSSTAAPTTVPQKKRRNQPGTPIPDAEVIALSPKTLMATNRFICEVCNKGFQREQNLQLHRRGHNLPWKLKQKSTKEPKRKVYLCPEPTCVHHDPSRALGDLTGIKKHYSRKHGEKKWKCEKCSKKYAVQSDWKAHSKTCGTREYRCDCGTLFSRRDSFITHRAFCDALAQESARYPLRTHLFDTNHMSLGISQVSTQISQLQNQNQTATNSIMRLGNGGAPKFEHIIPPLNQSSFGHSSQTMPSSAFFMNDTNQAFEEHQSQQGQFSNKQLHGLMQLNADLQGNTNSATVAAPSNVFNLSFFPNNTSNGTIISDQFNNISGVNQGTTLYINNNQVSDQVGSGFSSLFSNSEQHENMSPHMSATALLQKAAQMGSTTTTNNSSSLLRGMCSSSTNDAKSDHRVLVPNNVAITFESDHHRRGEDIIRSSMENDQQDLHGFMNSITNENTSIFGNVQGNQNNLCRFHNVEDSNNKLPQNLNMNFGGSDKLTLDFLGVGGMVRNMSGRFSQREQQQQQQRAMSTICSLDPDLKSAESSQHFGNSTL
ncbi:protein indeterminate-domain 5, chloroplastic-like [Gastrolobium bilobum]|uniref:protein indeterminate-domain 5, chloroplastic-like n=1 Tax=Gastrolobium bilobum TaxID=150636 RepID=UPI002AB247DA|nr:protein indeterminate-domain 5, chloroplastic-like [Gastrolobium bilobum]